MIREIKVVATLNGPAGARNIPDALAKGEFVSAARWQDGDQAKYFANDETEKKILLQQAGALGEEVDSGSFYEHLKNQWGREVADQAA